MQQPTVKRKLTFDFFGKIASASQFIELESGDIHTEVFGENLVHATAVGLIGHINRVTRTAATRVRGETVGG